AFLAFSSSEPAIAMNHMNNAQARAIAESGIERALWALSKGESTPGAVNSIADPLPAPVPAPYDGSQYVAMGVGGFIVTVAAGGAQYCAGVTPTSAAYSQGTVGTNGHPTLTGPTGASDGIAQNQPNSNFANFLFSDSDMALLKSLAKANNTYYQGNQTWTSPPPGGIIFVDTPSGNTLTNSSPSSDLITVDVHGNWGSGWNGWLVVAGSIHVSGNITMNGLL